MKKLLGLAALVLTIALAWFTLQDMGPAPAPGPDVPAAALSAETVGPQTRAALESVLGAMRAVKDPASADTIAPVIQAATIKLNAIAALGATLPDEGKSALQKIGEDVGAGIQTEIARIQGIPGAWEVLKAKMERFLLMSNIINGRSYEVLGTLDSPS
jgi:hypothetical protein